ncbi:hypothetical protein H696_02055 [Fonticula alba]|uniref:Rubicon Homology domain-containing protein n=1 Tax=Fonticula alba TaxID=691883 RepID=A0A058Z9Z3_FONAL|nr:hypothetical protein H696_02055 [Fonticula alba]KCV71109.1 hypothetical protein H696_02055 [Fonticula alba]|eukprot:XP_009494232.1 hypothetical protein H696_02055 [Fonticula alba]
MDHAVWLLHDQYRRRIPTSQAVDALSPGPGAPAPGPAPSNPPAARPATPAAGKPPSTGSSFLADFFDLSPSSPESAGALDGGAALVPTPSDGSLLDAISPGGLLSSFFGGLFGAGGGGSSSSSASTASSSTGDLGDLAGAAPARTLCPTSSQIDAQILVAAAVGRSLRHAVFLDLAPGHLPQLSLGPFRHDMLASVASCSRHPCTHGGFICCPGLSTLCLGRCPPVPTDLLGDCVDPTDVCPCCRLEHCATCCRESFGHPPAQAAIPASASPASGAGTGIDEAGSPAAMPATAERPASTSCATDTDDITGPYQHLGDAYFDQLSSDEEVDSVPIGCRGERLAPTGSPASPSLLGSLAAPSSTHSLASGLFTSSSSSISHISVGIDSIIGMLGACSAGGRFFFCPLPFACLLTLPAAENRSGAVTIARRTSTPFDTLRRGDILSTYKRQRFVLEVFPEPTAARVAAQLLYQSYLCPGCSRRINSPHYCYYTGFVLCSMCISQKPHPLPSQIVHEWNFSPKPIGLVHLSFMENIYLQPLFDLRFHNPRLFVHVDALRRMKELQGVLAHLKKYLQGCSRSLGLLERVYFDAPHLYENPGIYTFSDLLSLHKSPVLSESFMRPARRYIQSLSPSCVISISPPMPSVTDVPSAAPGPGPAVNPSDPAVPGTTEAVPFVLPASGDLAPRSDSTPPTAEPGASRSRSTTISASGASGPPPVPSSWRPRTSSRPPERRAAAGPSPADNDPSRRASTTSSHGEAALSAAELPIHRRSKEYSLLERTFLRNEYLILHIKHCERCQMCAFVCSLCYQSEFHFSENTVRCKCGMWRHRRCPPAGGASSAASPAAAAAATTSGAPHHPSHMPTPAAQGGHASGTGAAVASASAPGTGGGGVSAVSPGLDAGATSGQPRPRRSSGIGQALFGAVATSAGAAAAGPGPAPATSPPGSGSCYYCTYQLNRSHVYFL